MMSTESILQNQKDLRLLEAMKRIDSGSVKLLSIDIFDTLLWRKVPLPSDLFLLLGHQFKSEGWLIEGVTTECFAELRGKAETFARAKKAREMGVLGEVDIFSMEVTLKEIYWSLTGIFNKISIEQMVEGKKGIINESDINDLVSMELSLERKLTEFDLNILRLIAYAESKSVPIILVSNTYFELSQLTFLLERSIPLFGRSLLPSILEIYSSCEAGCGKRTGLFKKVIEKHQRLPHEILHIGDHPTSDYLAAQSEGIQTIYYEKYSKAFNEILEREWPAKTAVARREQLDEEQGDFGLTAIRAKMFAHKALAGMKKKDVFFWKYGATILGPILAGFTHWIYQRCKDLEYSQAFCLMREGRLYGELIKRCAPCYPDFPLEVKELWTSRHQMMQACVFHGTVDELLGVYQVTPAIFYSVETFCSAIGIDVGQLKQFAKYRHATLAQEDIRKELISIIINNPTLREEVVEISKVKRRNFLKHLSNLVDLSTLSRMLVVDVGWNGTIQGALQFILAKEGYPTQVHGLYLGTKDKVHFPLLQGFIREGYLLKAGFPQEYADVIHKGYLALEQCATYDLSPLLNFDDEGRMITGKGSISARQKHQIHHVQEGLYAFCQELNDYLGARAVSRIKWNAYSEPLERQLRNIFARSTSYPTEEEANKLGGWGHDYRSGEKLLKTLAKDSYYQTFIGDILPSITFEHGEILWAPAVAAKYDKKLTLATQAAMMKKIPRECFLSKDSIPLKIFIDTGKGFSKKATVQQSLHSNANRHFFGLVQLESIKKNIKQIKFELVCPEMFIRIKSLRMAIYTLDAVEPEELIFFEKNSNSKIACRNKQLETNLFHCENSENFMMEYAFHRPGIYQISINLCFEVFAV